LQQVIDVCGKDYQLRQVTENLYHKHQWPAANHWQSLPQTSITCFKSMTILTTNINGLQQVTDNLYHKHQWPAASHWQSLLQTSMTCCNSLTISTTNINHLLQVTDNLYHKRLSVTCSRSLMFVVKMFSDLQQVIDVCGKDCQWLAAGHWCLW
jgi:hypothetical protein